MKLCAKVWAGEQKSISVRQLRLTLDEGNCKGGWQIGQ